MIIQPLAQMKICATEYFDVQNIKCVENNKCFMARKRGQNISYEEKYTNGIVKKVYDSYLDTDDKQQEVHELKISYDIKIPDDAAYNEVAYSTHTIYYSEHNESGQ